ncbi:MAG: 50S ribosomal protein L22 [Chloroflexi bacterium]|nr:50S ribosomal protein L22 [Chloroflexota bacterium]
MEVSATTRYAGVSPSKVRLVLEHLPGRSVAEALDILKFMPTPHARLVAKIVKSAAANAENNFAMDTEALYVKRAVANDGRRLKRIRPAARGRVHRYQRRSSHITIVVEEQGS